MGAGDQVKLAFLGYHAPRPQGTAAGRQLFALGTALVEQGHDVSCLCWQPEEPDELPSWAQWRPVPGAAEVGGLRVRGRALVRPRSDVVRLGWRAPDDAVAIADDPGSYAGVAGHPQNVTLVHYAVRLDRRALHDWSPHHVQDLRGERRAVHGARQVWALSERVASAVGRGTFVPATVPMPDAPVDPVSAPVVGLLADWSWAPNVAAADHLIREWHRVRSAVPGAELVLAGRGENPVGSLAGVTWVGSVAATSDFLSRIAVFAFPCPATSGPKMKTLDAFAHGVPVVTTEAGVEGLVDPTGAVVSSGDRLPDALIELLRDPQRRGVLAARTRDSALRHHAPEVAARVRLATLSGGVLQE